ncbi:hypothetical protein [Flavobacterium sp. B183]|uniref:hypothetical protein n=1 Tax=Flavobacterium sp. B183 TaxID=907046 RepID=UPI00201FA3A3|nr:hypothetical protein [Flavobacterium sp. B183]URC11671.1 hypothetical protein M4I44_16400 [Flavobacterium sp. B183]
MWFKTYVKGGTIEIQIGTLINEAPSAGSAIKLLKTMEAEAKASGATKLIIEGKGVVETKLLNAQAWERLGYTIERIEQHSVRIYKNL